MLKIKSPYIAMSINGTAQFVKQFSTSPPFRMHLDEPEGPNIKTDIPGPKSQGLIKQLSELQVSLWQN